MSSHLRFSYFETRPGSQYDRDNACIIGLGTGLLSAVAVASAPSMVEILPYAVHAVRVAFRTGAIVSKKSSQLQEVRETKESWSMLIQNVKADTVQRELDEFYIKKVISCRQSGAMQKLKYGQKTSVSSRAYISAMSKGTVTISGAPVNLRELVSEADFFRTSKPLEIPVEGLYHSPLLYDNADVLEIMGSAGESTGKPWRPSRVVLSTANGSVLTAEAADILMEQAVSEVLKQPLKWDSCLEGMLGHIVKCKAKECLVFSLGTDQASRSIVAKLRIGSQCEVALQDLSTGFTTVAQASGKFSSSKIAIVGMSGRFPGQIGGEVGVEALWHLLETGLDVHRVIPKDRFDVETHYDPTGKKNNTSHTKYGCFIDKPGLFDARYFSMSPREAAQTDPMHRLALVTAAEALEMSGFVPNRTPSSHVSRVGTFYGQTSDDWREVNIAQVSFVLSPFYKL